MTWPILSIPLIPSPLSTMSFITFMSSPSAISNGPTLQDIVTGLIVPQTSVTPATYAAGQPPTPIFHTDACGVFGFADTYKNIPAGVKVGVRLRDTLALNISSLIFTGGQTPSEQMMEGYAEKSLSLVIQWPGCRQTAPYKASCTRPRWGPVHVAYEVAKMMQWFYKNFHKHVGEKGPARGWNIQNGDVPFDNLYLVELRWVGNYTFQPVLSYDADYLV
ncbi:hypothetical protein PHLGIDRAFT_118871 [Phlebiopsis gigantea 11061_1 CR5-6]|uniref:Uncharacterized protein n=1 Tax=Phlebiopsis gigantea (strain 11061_1 CR5-6) TaxID=745531 RepID=A0A0C3RXG8_PHLG1|nr:hypothetical protein PHLGIDRAFT_118871 [Phlebiopsis gigantea 11061_1 CR5-6]